MQFPLTKKNSESKNPPKFDLNLHKIEEDSSIESSGPPNFENQNNYNYNLMRSHLNSNIDLINHDSSIKNTYKISENSSKENSSKEISLKIQSKSNERRPSGISEIANINTSRNLQPLYSNTLSITSSITDLINPKNRQTNYARGYYGFQGDYGRGYINRRITTGSTSIFENGASSSEQQKKTPSTTKYTNSSIQLNSKFDSFKNRSEPALNRHAGISTYGVSTLKDELLNSEKRKNTVTMSYDKDNSSYGVKEKEFDPPIASSSLQIRSNHEERDSPGIDFGEREDYTYKKPAQVEESIDCEELETPDSRSQDLYKFNQGLENTTDDLPTLNSLKYSPIYSYQTLESSKKRNFESAISSPVEEKNDLPDSYKSPLKKVHITKESSPSNGNIESSPALESMNFKKIYRKSFFEKTKIWKTVQFFENIANSVLKRKDNL
ncbi:hypothetical protein AYI68_g449 [Smittium mucronatum]|uniref:Uncharacterized protein n=1 Tax=Smittium mucronatum TaxID=133383 RepID=A0A1R0H855_9FUNG|nr:hypothetical protein AYI68_g449 [Smittium mucronatum]